MLKVISKNYFFISYFYNFIVEILLNFEKRDRYLYIQIDGLYRFLRYII